ncbi:MAG TPA: ATP synthase F1 subunit gamma [Dehalococcoidia bacterium]|nr:ATP synthase F1 subunit gamma [Dehalococcoidia bacterium]
MATLRQIRRRIRSIQSTAKITRAMELVAASKMRRAQLTALAARPYAEKMRQLLGNLAETIRQADPEELPQLLQSHEAVNTIELIVISPDRGLSGGLPTNLNRATAQFILQSGHSARVVAAGRKGRDFLRRTGQNLVAEFIGLGDTPSFDDIRPIAQIAIQEFEEGLVDEVYLVYTDFVSTVVQAPRVLKLLPVEAPEESSFAIDYIYEPNRLEVLAELLPRYVERQVYEAVLEAIASEQSARMVAMRNATDAANDMMKELTLVYNKARQEAITRELLDIAGGVEALSAAS